MNEIPERAFVIAERLKERQSSEAEIRSALAEFELSEKQVKEILKKVEPQSAYMTVTDSQQRYLSGNSVGLRNMGDKRPVTIPGVKDSLYNSLASRETNTTTVGKPSMLHLIIDTLASIAIRLILVILAMALMYMCTATLIYR